MTACTKIKVQENESQDNCGPLTLWQWIFTQAQYDFIIRIWVELCINATFAFQSNIYYILTAPNKCYKIKLQVRPWPLFAVAS